MGAVGGVRFVFRGEVVELLDVPGTTSVLQWLRETGASRGTKEGCNQGDCGACTVVLADLVDDRLRLTTANSCLMLVPMLHGKALFTIEDVGTPDAMDPVQQAMVEHAGSQCGFCTPGFVMSMWRLAEDRRRDGDAPTRHEVTGALTGNLCRCTGYRPIVDAAVEAVCGEAGASRIDWQAVARDLSVLDAAGSLTSTVDGTVFAQPDTEDALARLLAESPGARIVAGGTDLVVGMRGRGELLDDDLAFVSVMGVPALQRIDVVDGDLVMGAATSLESAWSALVERFPDLRRMQERFASPGIRARGTIGGNLANSSPIADLVPVLQALDADVEVRSAAGSRRVAVADFSTGVRATVLAPGEFVARVRIPSAAWARDVRAYKVSRRFDDDISTVSAVLAIRLEGERIADVRVVFGGLATTVRRAPTVEEALRGRAWTRDAVAVAQQALTDDVSPIDDHRASAWYRLEVARGLIERWWLETGADAPAVEHDVWAVR